MMTLRQLVGGASYRNCLPFILQLRPSLRGNKEAAAAERKERRHCLLICVNEEKARNRKRLNKAVLRNGVASFNHESYTSNSGVPAPLKKSDAVQAAQPSARKEVKSAEAGTRRIPQKQRLQHREQAPTTVIRTESLGLGRILMPA